MTQRRRAPVVLAAVGLGFVAVAVGFFAAGGHRAHALYGNEFAIAVGFCAVGGLIASRVPRNSVGWILLAAGLVHATGLAGIEYLSWLPTDRAASQPPLLVEFAEVSWMPGFLCLFTFLPQLFPEGRPLGRRWRILLWSSGVGVTGALFAVLTGTKRWPDLHVANPAYHPALSTVIVPLGPVLVASIVGSIASVVVRYRRATGVGRQQLRWFVLACLVATLVIAPEIVVNRHNALTIGLQFLAVLGVPVAMGVAILRYRLYDIDRLVSRTVSYAVVTGLVAGVYIGVIAFSDRVVGGSSSFAVAASTLIAAAVFQPIRRRVQAVVDRRFDRAAYDARRTVDLFSARLRDQVDMDTVRGDLLRTVEQAVAPASASVWMART